MTGSSSPWRALAALTLLCLAYYAAARLGLSLAFAGSNASPVWPPSGIALGALLLGGWRLWPGVFIGALAANLTAFLDNNAAPGLALWLSTGIAIGNTVEATLGAFLLRKKSKDGELFPTLSSVYGFVAIAAGVCLIAALAGVAALSMANIVPRSLAPTVLVTWWLGDLVGMLAIVPAMVAWRGPAPLALRLRDWRWLCVPMVAALVYVIFGHRYPVDGASRWLAYLLVPAIGWLPIIAGHAAPV